MVFVALRVGVRRHIGGSSGKAATHVGVDHHPIMPVAGRARNKLTKPGESTFCAAPPAPACPTASAAPWALLLLSQVLTYLTCMKY